MSKQGQQGSSLVSQQGLAKSSNDSTNFSESINEHPSSSAPFGDKKDFFEKLSSKSDDQAQQGSISSDTTSSDFGKQGIKDTEVSSSSSSDLKQSSGSSDLKQESSSSDLKQSSGTSDFKEHPSSSAPFGDKKDFFEKLSSKSDDQVQQGSTTSSDVGKQGIKDTEISSSSSFDLKQSSGSSDLKQESSSSDLKQSSGSSDLKQESSSSDLKQESFKEHPSSSAPFGDKKDFFEKLSSKTDDQVQQGSISSDTTSSDVGKQGIKDTEVSSSSSSDLKQSSGTSGIKQESSSSDLKQSSGTSIFDKGSFEEQDEGSSFEQHGLISEQGLHWQGPHESEHEKHGLNWNKEGSTNAMDQGTELREMSGPASDLKESYDFKDSSDLGKQGIKDTEVSSSSSSDLKQSSGTSGFDKGSFNKQDEGSSFGSDIKWQGASDESEWNAFGSKNSSSDVKKPSGSSNIKGSDVDKTTASSEVKDKRDSDLIDFTSTETKQDTNSTSGAMDLSGEISNLKIDSSSSLGKTKKQSVETGPFYDDKVHDERNDTK